MKSNIGVLIIGFVLVFLLGAFISKIVGDKKLERVKQFSDSLAVVATQRELEVNRANDSTKAAVAALKKVERQLMVEVAVNDRVDVQLDSALITASTMADSNKILTQQVTNLRGEVLTLKQAMANVTAQRDSETTRADNNLNKFNEANRNVIRLDAEVQSLQPKLPKLVRYGIEGVKLGVVFYAGYKVGESQP